MHISFILELAIYVRVSIIHHIAYIYHNYFESIFFFALTLTTIISV